MEKIFTPNRWFVLFCGLLILVWGALRIVADVRLCEHAKLVGESIFTYSWPELSLRSEVESIKAQVVRRGSHDAVVTVTGTQVLSDPLKSGIQSGKEKAQSGQSASSAELNAVLTFYRSEDRWELGKVELK
ncbi:MAG: hypothetical protein R3C24_03710 [Cyanobacteriota/Melainabacteria group bacterium]